MFILNEQSDVFVDAMASDHHGQLLFVSVFGRDTAVQQLMARLHQSSRDGGVDQLSATLALGQRPRLTVLVGDPRRLDKATGRMPRTGLLGNLVHAWIFDPAVLGVDHATRSAWILEPGGEIERTHPEVWRLIQELSPVPLLDAWRDRVIAQVQGTGGLVAPSCIGRIKALRVELQEDFPAWVSSSVRDGHLAVPGTGSIDTREPEHELEAA